MNRHGEAQKGGMQAPPNNDRRALKMGPKMLWRNGGNDSKMDRNRAAMSNPGKPTWADAAVDVRTSAPATAARVARITTMRRVMTFKLRR